MNENDSKIVENLISLPVSEQLVYLLKVKDNIRDDSCYWQVVAGVWLGSEVCSPYLNTWRDLFTEPRRNRQKLMKGSDRKVWHSLVKRGAPKLITAYRAMNPTDDLVTAISWTLNKKVAQQLANGRKIISLEIPKECIIAYFDRRREQEIICLYEEVYIRGI
jgi:hypothetical protein